MYATVITDTTSHKKVSDQRPPNQFQHDIYPLVLGKLELVSASYPKNVNNDSVSPSSRVLREEDVHGVE
ncbi:hypothetical protein Tco_0293030, partial [Tanacetum coccineum]